MVGAGNSSDGRGLDKVAGRQVTAQSAAILNLGKINQVAPSDTSELAQRVFALIDQARSLADTRGPDWATQAPLTFKGYKTAIQKRDSILRALHQESRRDDDVYIPDDSPELRRF